jgi:leader peptidase (prepilin peptidase)/N-methyltransferase
LADVDAVLGPLIAAWAALFGALVGSFLNVVIARVPAGESVVHPRSRCPRCKAAIAWYDNVPILSWLILRARCRGCGARISVRYPLVEAAGAALAFSAYHRHGISPAALAELAFTATSMALALIDLDTWLLPNALTWPLIAVGLLASGLGVAPAGTLRLAVYGACLGGGAFWLVSWLGAKAFKKEALGLGDVWLLGAFGAWMGPGPLLPIVLLASVQGTIAGLALMALGRAQPGPGEPPAGGGAPASEEEEEWVPPKNAVPFGPFLVAGALEWLWFAGAIARAVPTLELFR